MRFIKLAIISVIILFLLITALSLLLPSHVRVSRAINISATRENIAPYISDLNQWSAWNRFVIQADSLKNLEIVSDSFVKARGLEIHLMKTALDSISTRWRQPLGKVSESNFILIPGEHYTVVQWYFDFHLDWYPWQKFQSIIYDKQLGPYMEGSLQNLKQIMETPR
ncbi:MAG TPA: SRPBCC family protein [Chitinophagaceae bacterium]|nr:SRPBCC family protein [Chitinophagaceae bacterium]